MTQKLFCPIRREWVAALPEEIVRQKLILFMTETLKFPVETLAVEVALKSMPHLKNQEGIPNRRADIVCFAKGIHPDFDLYPLLMVECKAVPLTQKVISQVVGYNNHVQAHFVSVVNEGELKTGWYDETSGEYSFMDNIIHYDEMLERSALNRS